MMWCCFCIFACSIVAATVFTFADDADVLVLTVGMCTHHGGTEAILAVLAVVLVADMCFNTATATAAGTMLVVAYVVTRCFVITRATSNCSDISSCCCLLQLIV